MSASLPKGSRKTAKDRTKAAMTHVASSRVPPRSCRIAGSAMNTTAESSVTMNVLKVNITSVAHRRLPRCAEPSCIPLPLFPSSSVIAPLLFFLCARYCGAVCLLVSCAPEGVGDRAAEQSVHERTAQSLDGLFLFAGEIHPLQSVRDLVASDALGDLFELIRGQEDVRPPGPLSLLGDGRFHRVPRPPVGSL